MKPNSFHTSLARPKLVVHDYSHTVFKQKPKIRIIHIVEPEIIKTDVKDFQELVQRLTGNKPVERKGSTSNRKRSSSCISHPEPCFRKTENKVESTGAPILLNTHRVKKEVEEEAYDAENGAAFFSFLEELDGFLHDVNEFPSLSYRSSQINTLW